jgi:hypothetical protein
MRRCIYQLFRAALAIFMGGRFVPRVVDIDSGNVRMNSPVNRKHSRFTTRRGQQSAADRNGIDQDLRLVLSAMTDTKRKRLYMPACRYFRLDSDDAHHPAGMPLRGSMREEQVCVAVGTPAGGADGGGLYACVEKLAAIGFDEIEMQLRADGGMARSALSEEEHGVFGSDGVGIVDLAEELARIAEL